MRHETSRILVAASCALVLVVLSACSEQINRETTRPVRLSLGPPRVVALPNAIARPALFASKDAFYLVRPEPGMISISISRDGGRSWQPILGGPRPGMLCEYDQRVGDFHFLHVRAGGIEHEAVVPTGPAAVTRVADIAREHLGHLVLRSFPDGVLGIVWTDSSSGWPQVLFSASTDHGKTWSAPAPVEAPSHPAEVFAPFLDRQAGRWYLTWPEHMGRSTLFDIRLAQSRDGRAWVHGPRLNDDKSNAWNWLPVSCGDGRHLFVAFSDYRERDSWGEPDENVYFTRVALPSGKAAKNRRLNDAARGSQSYPRLALDQVSGRLLSVWLDSRDRLTHDIYASFSDDSGETWSANQKITGPHWRRTVLRPELVHVPGGHFYIGWAEVSGGRADFYLTEVLGTLPELPLQGGRKTAAEGTSAPSSERQPAARLIQPSEYSMQSLHPGDFASEFEDFWTPVAGRWLANGDAVVGFGRVPSYLTWRGKLDDFAVEGRFRLNRLRHYDASLIFRSTADQSGRPRHGFMLRNHFRQGVWLIASDSGFDTWERSGAVVGEVSFPFRSDTWYRFRLVVLGDRLEYYVDNRLMLVSREVGNWRSGDFSLSTGGSPAEFADITLYRLRTAKQ